MPMLESTEVFGRCLSFHSKEPILLLLNCPCKHILLKEASFLKSYCIKKNILKLVKCYCSLLQCYRYQMPECKNASEWHHSMLCISVECHLPYCSLEHPICEELLAAFSPR